MSLRIADAEARHSSSSSVHVSYGSHLLFTLLATALRGRCRKPAQAEQDCFHTEQNRIIFGPCILSKGYMFS